MASPFLLVQQVVTALTAKPNACPDTRAVNGTISQDQTQPGPSFPTDISSLIAFLLSLSALGDWFKLIVLGGVLETCRRLAFHFYRKIYNSFFITATFEEDDSSYDWMMVWLSSQPFWKQARDVQITTRNFGLNSNAIMIEGEPEDSSSVVNGNRQLSYLPSTSSVHSFWYKRRWVRVTRTVREGYYGRREDVLEICILSMDHRILNELLIEAKKTYKAAEERSISIYVSDTNNNWRHIASRPKRPLNSIVLDPGIKDLLVDDAKDFLESKPWYSARGIPFRRGYLLYGAPGSGKTSIIHSLAGELGLDVYVISLSRAGLDDAALNDLISDLPEKCIALMEDIDAAFSHTVNREQDNETPSKLGHPDKPRSPPASTSRITLSGLLNALDGVGAQEGRILFATTNKYNALDPALCRPGRMDIHVEFKLASKYQARELYRCFYFPDSESDEEDSPEPLDEKPSKSPSEKDSSNSEPTSFSGHSHQSRKRKLRPAEVDVLAAQFGDVIPEREFSMASLQGYLMTFKIRPEEAIKDAPAWIEKERAERVKNAKAADVPVVPASDATGVDEEP